MEKATVLTMTHILETYISTGKLEMGIAFCIFRQALDSSDDDAQVMKNFIDQLQHFSN